MAEREAAHDLMGAFAQGGANGGPKLGKGPPHSLSFTVAPFRAWRSLKCAVGEPIRTLHGYPKRIRSARMLLWGMNSWLLWGMNSWLLLEEFVWVEQERAVLHAWHS